MLTLFLSLIALTVMGMLWFSRKREDYQFLTVDETTGDLAIVDASSGLEALSEGGLQTTGNFNVKGALTTDSTINQVTIGSGGVNGVTIGSNKVNGVTLLNKKVIVDTGGELCIGIAPDNITCVNQDHLKMLTGDHDVFITGNNRAGKIKAEGTYTNGHKIEYSTAQDADHAKWRLSRSYP